MKIQKKGEKKVLLRELSSGDVFEYKDYFYMVINFAEIVDCSICGEELDVNHCYNIACVDLQEGEVYNFNGYDEVYKVNGKFIEE